MVDRWALTPSVATAHRRVTWRSPRSRPTPPPAGFILPCQPTLVAYPPVGPGWLHEMKHDGYRLIARKDAGRVVLWSRYGTDFTEGRTEDRLLFHVSKRAQDQIPLRPGTFAPCPR